MFLRLKPRHEVLVSMTSQSRENLEGLCTLWSCLELQIRCLGIVLVLVSNHNISFYKLIFSCRSSLKLVIKLSVHCIVLHAIHAVCYMPSAHQSHTFSSFCLLRPTCQLRDIAVHATWIWQKRRTVLHIRMSNCLINVTGIATIKWTRLWILHMQLAIKRQHRP